MPVIEFVKLRSSPAGWRTCAMVERGPASMFEFVDFRSVIPAIRSRSGVVCQR